LLGKTLEEGKLEERIQPVDFEPAGEACEEENHTAEGIGPTAKRDRRSNNAGTSAGSTL
jgi:hypothetical protein